MSVAIPTSPAVGLAAEAPRREWPALVLVFALALAVKCAFVLALSDVFFYGEELEKGTAAKAMLDGLPVPHHQLAYHYYEGGGFVVSHLKALAFLLVGENYLAHKLVALAFFGAVLAVGMLLARELYGPRTARWFALLLTFGPISFQKLPLISLGIHFEACLFIGLAMWFTARLTFRQAETGRWDFAALGIIVGFGTYFSYQLAVVAAWALLVLIAARPRDLFGRRVLAPGALYGLGGFMVGALPLWVMFALVGDAIFDIHGTALSGAGVEVARGEKLRAFVGSLYTRRGALEVAGAVVFPLALAAALTVGLMARGPLAPIMKLRTSFLALFLAVFAAAYTTSAFVQGEVYHFFVLLRLAPAWFVGTLAIAGGVAWLLDREEVGARRAGVALAGAPLLVGVVSAVAILVTAQPLRLAANWDVLTKTKGYVYGPYFAKLVPHLDGTREEQLATLLEFDEPARDWLRAEIASELFKTPAPELQGAFAAAQRAIAAADAGAAPAYERGLGALLMNATGWDQPAALAQAGAAPGEIAGRLCEALGRFGSGPHPTPEVLARELRNGADAADAADRGAFDLRAFDRGLGWRLRVAFPLDADAARAWIAERPAERAAELSAGYEAALAAHRLP